MGQSLCHTGRHIGKKESKKLFLLSKRKRRLGWNGLLQTIKLNTMGNWRGQHVKTINTALSLSFQSYYCTATGLLKSVNNWVQVSLGVLFSMKLEEQAAKHKLRIKLHFAVVCPKLLL